MRKQYHFRNIGQELYIWDVHYLLELTKNLTPKTVLLADIQELNEAY